MVSTRHHPRQFPEPDLPPSRTATPTKASPTKSRSKSTSRSATTSAPASPVLDGEPSTAVVKTPKPRSRKSTSSALSLTGHAHTPHLAILVWLAISLPLVAWDTFYVMLRPHTMPGGRLHSPFFTPYALYGTIDYMYGWPAWNNKIGFTAAQGTLNLLESALYCWYIYVVGLRVVDWSYEGIKELEVKGKGVNLAVLLGFSGAVMTVSKTILYWFNEMYSGFDNIGHNSLFNLIVLWIIPNGAWLVMPSFMIYMLGKEILASMNANGNGKKTR